MANLIDLTPEKDGGVLKEIVREGSGDANPSKGCTVYVYYHGTLEDGTVFDSSKDRKEEFKFQLGVGQVIKAWDIGVASMKKGELCNLKCAAKYAYGEAGSPPTIPPNSTLNFEVELLRWTYEDISPEKNGSIEKRIIVEGELYSMPKDLSEVTLHLRGVADGQVFDERDVTFIVGEASLSEIADGVEIAVQTMKLGEKSEIILRKKYAAGGKVPAGKDEVSYVVTLLNFEKAKECWEMDGDEKLKHSQKNKERGTEHFKAGRLEQALKYYKRVHEFMKTETSLSDEPKKERDALFLSALLNLSLVSLKLEDHLKCIEYCQEVLAIEPNNVKAIFRKGQAKLGVCEFDDAAVAFAKCVELEPDNKAAAAQLQVAKAKKKAQFEKEKNLYRNMFAKLSETAPEEPASTKPEEGVWQDASNKENPAEPMTE